MTTVLTTPESKEGSKGKLRTTSVEKAPWTVEVDVYLEKGCPDPTFRLHSTLPCNSAGDLIFENNHRPGFTILFNLHDETGSGYVFPPTKDVEDAVWSQRGDECPTSEIHEVFDPIRVINDRKTLVVRNLNPHPALGPFKYTLRVTNNGGESYCDLDPGGDDKNGPAN